jgi:hypothetical protein
LRTEDDSTKAKSDKKIPIVPLFLWLANCAKRYVRERNAQKEKETGVERSNRVASEATVVIAFFAFVAAFIALSQAVIGNRTLNEMQAEQRPILWTGNNLGAPTFYPKPNATTGQVTWPVHFTNYGRGFISDGIVKSYIKVGKRPFEQSYGQTAGDVLAPIAPNQDMFLNAISSPGIEHEDFDTLMQLGAQDDIAIKFTFKYFDLAGNSYQSSVCLRRLNLGAISYCKTENQVK